MEKRTQHGISHADTVLWHWGKYLSLMEVFSAFCWFYVVIRFGSESRDHSMRSCSCQKKSIWGIKYGKICNLPHGALPGKNLIQLLFDFPHFHKNSWRPNTAELFLTLSDTYSFWNCHSYLELFLSWHVKSIILLGISLLLCIWIS